MRSSAFSEDRIAFMPDLGSHLPIRVTRVRAKRAKRARDYRRLAQRPENLEKLACPRLLLRGLVRKASTPLAAETGTSLSVQPFFTQLVQNLKFDPRTHKKKYKNATTTSNLAD
jgi:hypothetical protein